MLTAILHHLGSCKGETRGMKCWKKKSAGYGLDAGVLSLYAELVPLSGSFSSLMLYFCPSPLVPLTFTIFWNFAMSASAIASELILPIS